MPGSAAIVRGTLLFLLLARLAGFAADGAEAFDAANKLYEQGRYREAVAAYEALAQARPGDAALHFNLGNAQFKAGQIGRAIVAYRQASRLAPRDPDIQANLHFARDQVAGPTLRPGWFRRQMDALTLNEWTWLAVLPGWLGLGLLTARSLKPALAGRLRGFIVLAGFATLLGGAGLAVALAQRSGERVAVVIARDTVVRHGPLAESQSAFTAGDGAELRLLDAKDGWLQVTDGDRLIGWLPRETVAPLP